MFRHAAAAGAKYSRGMCFVDHQHRRVFVEPTANVLQRREIAIHAEQRIGHDQPPAILARIAKQIRQMVDIAVSIDMNFRPR